MLNGASARQIDGSGLYQLLRLGEYEKVADFLYEVQLASEAAGNSVVANAAATVRQICLACCQCRAEVEWHREASQTAEQRENQLRNHARVMLDRVCDQALFPLIKTAPLPTLYAGMQPLDEPGPPSGLRQRIQNLLAWGKRVFLLDAQDPFLLFAEKTALPVFSAIQETEKKSAALAFSAVEQAALMNTFTVKPIEEPAYDAAKSQQAEAVWLAESATDFSATQAEGADEQGSPALTVYCLGSFRVYQDDQPVEEWPSSKGQAIFKYLLMHRTRPIAKEVLMELFWPDAAPDAARNNLNVAIYGLRRALRSGRADFSHIVFQNDCYLLNPTLGIWLDVEEFAQHFAAGQRLEQAGEKAQAMQEYRAAEALYLGEFLAEDRYEDWPLAYRQQLQDEYVRLADRLSQYYLDQQDYELCAMMCGKLLNVDACQEEAHRRLMRCYSRQGHLHLAVRQYHFCVEALVRELDVGPSAPTEELYTQIRRRKPV